MVAEISSRGRTAESSRHSGLTWHWLFTVFQHPMLIFVVRRLAIAALTVWGAVTLIFLLLRIGGDPASALLPANATAQDLADVNKALGFDRPLLTQYWDYLSGAVHGDLGTSYGSSTPAVQLVMNRLPVTLELALYSFLFGLITAIAAVLAAHLVPSVRIRGWLRSGLLWLGSLRQAIPIYLFAIITVLVFSVILGWLPSSGDADFKDFILPVVTLGSFEFSLYARLLDSALIEQSKMDFTRTARAKGIPRRTILLRHTLPNAVVPLITVAALNFANLLGGVVVVEVVFNWQGLGQLVFTSVNNRDIPTVQAALLITATFFVLINLAADLCHMAIDPRVRPR